MHARMAFALNSVIHTLSVRSAAWVDGALPVAIVTVAGHAYGGVLSEDCCVEGPTDKGFKCCWPA